MKRVHIIQVLAKQEVNQRELIRPWLSCEGALCKMNLILSSITPSMEGVDPSIDDWTPLFFARVSTDPPLHLAPPRLCGDWSLIDAKPVFKKLLVYSSALHSQRLTGCRRNAASGPQTWDLWAVLPRPHTVKIHPLSFLSLFTVIILHLLNVKPFYVCISMPLKTTGRDGPWF